MPQEIEKVPKVGTAAERHLLLLVQFQEDLFNRLQQIVAHVCFST